MVWFQVFKDGPEYEARKRRKAFSPPNVSLKCLHDAVPHHLLEKSTLKSIYYIVVHVSITVFLYLSARRISPVLDTLAEVTAYPLVVNCLIRPLAWLFFWAWQGMFFAGLWTLGVYNCSSINFKPTLFLPGHEASVQYGSNLVHAFNQNPGWTWCFISETLGQRCDRNDPSYIRSDTFLFLESDTSLTSCKPWSCVSENDHDENNLRKPQIIWNATRPSFLSHVEVWSCLMDA